MLARKASAADPVQPLAPTLPQVPRDQLTEHNARCRRVAPMPVETSLGPWQVARVGAEAVPAWEGGWTRIGFSAGGREGALWLPRDLVAGSLGKAFPDADLAGLPGEDAAVLLELAERAGLDALGRALRAEVAVADVAPAEAPPPGAAELTFAVSGGGASYPAHLACHPVERERLMRLFTARPPQREPIPGLVVTIAFRCGHTALSLEDFASLEPGSGIAMDDTTLGFQKLVAVVSERYVQTCAWQTIKPTLEGPLLKRADPLTILYTTNGFAMNDPEARDGHASGSVGEVPINLVFELGRTEVPLSDLETVQAGYVFDLRKPLSQSVDILANGRRVGSGELVRLGDSIGVRVTRLLR